MTLILLREIGSVFKVPCLSTNSDGSIQVKRKFARSNVRVTFRLGSDKIVETSDVFELCVSVEKESGVL